MCSDVAITIAVAALIQVPEQEGPKNTSVKNRKMVSIY